MKPNMIMLVGLPGSGKSTVSKQIKAEQIESGMDCITHSSDALREELYGDENIQGNNQELFIELHRRIKQDLIKGKSVIYDACNINSKKRKAFIDELKSIDCNKVCYLIMTPYNVCLEQNNKRDRIVPEDVIKRMYMNFNIPYWFEGWDDIKIIKDNKYNLSESEIDVLCETMGSFDQKNKHHTLTLGSHCIKTYLYVKNNQKDDSMEWAAIFHDVGKIFTQSFIDSKGNHSENAHYYQHHCVGAYDSFFLTDWIENDNMLLEMAILINLHMTPYEWERDNNVKHMEKCKTLWGSELFDKVMILHEADKMAH